MRYVASSEDEVCVKPIDFFSIGHVIFGYVSYLIILLLTFSREWSVILTQILAFSWEILENKVLLKFKKRKDSLENSLADIAFVSIGCFFSLYLSLWDFYFISSVIVVHFLLILMEVFKKKTYKKKK